MSRLCPGFCIALLVLTTACAREEPADDEIDLEPAEIDTAPSAGAGDDTLAGAGMAAGDTAYAYLVDLQGEVVGEIVLAQAPQGVGIRGDLSGLPPGVHGFHIHQTGQCDPPFESAGTHLNPSGKEHGLENPAGPHDGDLPNVTVPENGVGTVDAMAPLVSLTGPNSLFDADSSAIIVHADQDDQLTGPSGNSGMPIACGVITRGRQPAS